MATGRSIHTVASVGGMARHSPTLSSSVTIAIDAGTTGIRSLVVDEAAQVVDVAYGELTQHFPRPGWVEHDADQIWDTVRSTLIEVASRLRPDQMVQAIGITNQRETVVAWDRSTGRPLHRALVWQDRRTADRCSALADAGHQPLVRAKTGLTLDPYFSATKMRWLLEDGGVPVGPRLALGTVDSWILWNLTGGVDGGVFATDATNASRTLLYDIVARAWSEELCELFGVPTTTLAEVRPSCGTFGNVAPEVAGGDARLAGVPISAMLGDQHAALFGQACFRPGMTKVTFGTGSFVVMHAGSTCPAPVEGLLTTIAWDLGSAGGSDETSLAYAIEGSVFVAGAGVQWLRDGLGIIDNSAELEPLAQLVASSDGVTIVPAFTGLGSPHWDPAARGIITGLSRGSGRGQLARAMIEAMGFQVRDVLEAMAATGTVPATVRVDGGASVMNLLLQHVADQVRLDVTRPTSVETTALGAATMAGLAEGVWRDLDELATLWSADTTVSPTLDRDLADSAHATWTRALDRSRHWAH